MHEADLIEAFKPVDLPEGTLLPRVTLVIPTLNSSQSLAWTLRSLNFQTHEDIELVIVDAGSTDRTFEVVRKGYRGAVRISSVASYNLVEMYNYGISLATGKYVSLLLPGDAYLSQHVLEHVLKLAIKEEFPDLVYCGCFLSERSSEPQITMGQLTLEMLHIGEQPTSLQGCWFRADTIKRLGKLDGSYRFRGGLDLFCRILLYGELRISMLARVFVDQDRRHYSSRDLIVRAWETSQIIRKYFGLRKALYWWIGQNQWKFLRLWWKSQGVLFWT